MKVCNEYFHAGDLHHRKTLVGSTSKLLAFSTFCFCRIFVHMSNRHDKLFFLLIIFSLVHSIFFSQDALNLSYISSHGCFLEEKNQKKNTLNQ